MQEEKKESANENSTEKKTEDKLNIEELKKPAPEGRRLNEGEPRPEAGGSRLVSDESERALNEIERQLEECQKLKDEYLAGWQRARADLLNYKKEEMERIGEILNYAGEEMILKILPILDNFDIIEKKLPENLKNDESVKGILQIKIQILDFLKQQGVEEIESIGQEFDPNFHEAVGEVEPSSAPPSLELRRTSKASEGKESGIIIEEIQKGYKINGRVLRPAKVKIVK